MTARTWTVQSDALPQIQKLMARMGRKATKLGVAPLTMTYGPEYVKEDGDFTYALRDVTVTGNTPKLNGYEFAATIQHAGEAGNILRTVPTFTADIPERYRTASPECDHCRMNRRRNDTYLVHHTDTGKFRQVGSTCMADFLGSDAVANTMALAEWWSLLSDEFDGLNERNYKGKTLFRIAGYMPYVAESVLRNGWVPRSKAGYGNTATADSALTMMQEDAKGKRGNAPSDKAFALANTVLEWVPVWTEKALSRGHNDYVWNMHVVFQTSYCEARGLGLVASAVGAWQREMDYQLKQAQARKDAPISEYRGTVDKRETFVGLTLQAVKYLEGLYVSVLHTFTDGNGNVFTWFASKDELTIGKTYDVTARVTAHKEFQGVKQTVITRAKVK